MTDRPLISSIELLYARIAEFVRRYGGVPPETASPESFALLVNFFLIIDAEIDFTVKPKQTGRE